MSRRLAHLSRRAFRVRNRASWLTMVGHSFKYFHENDLFTSAAAMSYFGLLTLFPALLLLLILGNSIEAGNDLLTRIVEAYPGSREFLRTTVRSLTNVGTGIIVGCVITVIWAGSWVFGVIEQAINRIWGTRPRPFWRGRALEVGMIGGIGLLLVASMLFTSMLVMLRHFAAGLSPRSLERYWILGATGNLFWRSLFALASYLVTITLFVLVYRVMPNGRVALRDTIPSAVLAGLFWETTKYVFANTLQYFHYDDIYGPVGAVVAVLTWGYISSLILLYGAQLSAVLHYEHPPPQEEAVAVMNKGQRSEVRGQ